MLKAIYPGSFDPITNGHLDIIQRAAGIVDTLVVAILENPNKKSLFTVEQRKEHIELVTRHLPNVEVASFQGLMVEFAKSIGANVVIRGLRTCLDFENEMQMANVNKKLDPDLETLFIASSVENTIISSTAVKEAAVFGGNIDFMVPAQIKEIVMDKYRK